MCKNFMKVTTGWLYHIDQNSDIDITIESDDPVAIIDQTVWSGINRKILVSGATQCTIYGALLLSDYYDVHIVTHGEHAVTNVRYALVSAWENALRARIISQLATRNTTTDMHIVSLVADDGEIILDGTVQIDEGIEKASGHILEENIFLGSKGKIKGIPSLLVRSNDVVAGHAARMERIPDDKLYYLRARWIPKDDATVMMIRSSISQVFDGLEKFDEKLKDTLIQTVLEHGIHGLID